MSLDTHQKSNLYGVAQGIFMVLYAIVFFVVPGRWLFESDAASIAGDVLALAGLLLMAAAFVSLRKVIQIVPEPRADGQLITGGVYRRLRHPIYSGIVLIILGLFLREPAIGVAICGAAVTLFLVIKSRFEERLLAGRYPDYAEYRKHTWGVLPGL